MSSSLDRIGEEIAADVTHHDAALHRILTKLRLFDAGGGYVSQGFRTCAQWLSWRVNWTLTTARSHVRVANALGGLPMIDRALETGKLSYSKVRALTRVATLANEATLVEMAFHMTGEHLEKACRKLAAVKSHDASTKPDDDMNRRYLRRRDREDGMVVIEAVLHPDEAEIVYAAVERIAKERCRAKDDGAASVSTPVDTATAVSTDSGSAGPSPRSSMTSGHAGPLARRAQLRDHQRTSAFDRASGLVDMAQQVLRGTSPERAPVDVMITVPIDILTSRQSDSHSCCSAIPATPESSKVVPHAMFTASGTFVSDSAARRLACDAGVIALVVDADGNALSVGRKSRTLPASLKRAMLCRDRKCRYPGCNATAFLQGHHLEEWALGGITALDNVLSLCSYHHRFVHEYGFRLELDPKANTVTVYDPRRDRRIPAVTRPDPVVDLGWPNILRHNDCSLTADTQPTWDATPVDYGAIIDVILRAEDREAAENDEPCARPAEDEEMN